MVDKIPFPFSVDMSIEDFRAFVKQVQEAPEYKQPYAFGIGWATIAKGDVMIDTFFPTVNSTVEIEGVLKLENAGSAAIFAAAVGHLDGSTATYKLDLSTLMKIRRCFSPFKGDGKRHPNIEAVEGALNILSKPRERRKPVLVFLGSKDDAPVDVPDIYLRLALMSYRKVLPNTFDLENIFGKLPNVCWTDKGPMLPEEVEIRRADGERIMVKLQDKFPSMLDYVTPGDKVRIADASRVRFGAYLGDGTTVMHEGFVNFNAGCAGPNMVEGRISAGVFVGAASNIGGGASIMGTLSGGGKHKIKVGKKSLLGANSGIGISLGDQCTVEAGTYVTASKRVTVKSARIQQALIEAGVKPRPNIYNTLKEYTRRLLDESLDFSSISERRELATLIRDVRKHPSLEDAFVVKAIELSGMDGMLFITNSETGALEVHDNKNFVELNAALHGTAPSTP